MCGGYISFFTNSNYFSDADLQNALPDFQSQVSHEFNWYWGLSAYLDINGGGSPVVITDYGGDPTQIGYLGYHDKDGSYNPYAIIYADVCAYYGYPITGVISHELLEMMAEGARALGMATAGGASAEDATTIFYNPAGMTFPQHDQAIVGGDIFLLHDREPAILGLAQSRVTAGRFAAAWTRVHH